MRSAFTLVGFALVLLLAGLSCRDGDEEEREPTATANPTITTPATTEPTTPMIAFQSKRAGKNEIYVINADGSDLIRLTDDLGDNRDPAWSPNGSQLIFVSHRTGDGEVMLMSADGVHQASLVISDLGGRDRFSPVSSPDGNAVAFILKHDNDYKSLNIVDSRGSNPIRIKTYDGDSCGMQDPAWSPDSSQLAFINLEVLNDCVQSVFIVNPDGSGLTNISNSDDRQHADECPVWSPDGSRIAFRRSEDVFSVRSDGSEPVNLTNNPTADGCPAWSPDGTQIAFLSDRDGGGIFVINADGSGASKLADKASEFRLPRPEWSPNGTQIAFAVQQDNNWDIYVVNSDGSSLTQLTNHPADDENPVWRPTP
jgi:Tol biopolymer transport system component